MLSERIALDRQQSPLILDDVDEEAARRGMTDFHFVHGRTATTADELHDGGLGGKVLGAQHDAAVGLAARVVVKV